MKKKYMNFSKRAKSLPPLFRFDTIFLSYLGLGFFPFMPGTIGSIGTLPLLSLFFYLKLSLFTLISLIVILFIISSYLTEKIQKEFKYHDPSWIVIDEVLGMIVTYLFYPSDNPTHLLIILGLFRFFDILKPWPISYFDKKITHGTGVILDDIVAGLFAGIVYLLIKNFMLSA